MSGKLTKPERAVLMEKAEKHGWTQAAIAREIGTTRANLWNILNRESERSPYLTALDEWLLNNCERSAVLLKESQVPTLETAMEVMAGKLESLAETLRSQALSEEYKALELKSFVDNVRNGFIKSREDD